jgi:hypothetical protein
MELDKVLSEDVNFGGIVQVVGIVTDSRELSYQGQVGSCRLGGFNLLNEDIVY